MYWSAAGGGRVGSPEIEAVYAGLGGASGTLGASISKLLYYPANGGGVAQAFTGGSVYSSSAGTYAVTGGLLAYYWSRRGESGTLGWPSGNQACGLPNGECSQKFQGGTVYWSAAGGGRITK